MKLHQACLAAFLCVTGAFAESWPTVEQLATKAALVVHGRAGKSADGTVQYAVVETWKGAYSPQLFAPPPPPGFVPSQDKTAATEGEAVLVFMDHNRSAGKFTGPDIVVPIVDGGVDYPGKNASPNPQKRYTLAAFKAAVQAATKFPLVNGDFDASPVGSLPDGWKAAYPTGHAVVATDGKDTFVRLSAGQVENAGVAQVVPVPGKATRIAVLGRMRGKPKNERDEKRAAVEVALRFQDAKGGMINAGIVASGSSPSWRTFRREFDLPPGCAQVEVAARSIFAIGTFDFDTVRVEFK